MTDNWSLKGKGDYAGHFERMEYVFHIKDIETLRQKLIDDILKFYDANCCLVSEEEKKELIELINKRFGVEVDNAESK